MRVLLTGAAGFIGAHVHSALIDAGHDVVALDALIASAHGEDPSVPNGLRRSDVRDGAALDDALQGVDVVCHQAAVVGAGIGAQDAPAYASHNDFGTAVLLAAMDRAGCHRLVLASSMVVYGEGRYRSATSGTVEPLPRRREDLDNGIFDNVDPATGETLTWELVDEDAPLRPRSTYAASKVAQEHYALAWAAAVGGSVVALRYHNVYGDQMPRDTPYSGVAAMFRSALEAGQPPRVYEDGLQARDFVHVTDVAAANRAAVEAQLDGFVPLNVCSGHPITIGEVAATLSERCGGPAPVVTGQYRSGDVRHIVASAQRASGLIGFTAQVLPTDGLADFATAPLREASGHSAPQV
ncbi:NAD-dependent epimerase/dehydratase family protein [Antrihabitans cavernicola]|uniref:NAD-dependent epimerase/dehydratase family protein n=1 Tax=Antrihabitans cavernicola TaxID=2495913 RepID=A0A5A7SAF8_9NOCA|nr:NAD-dependent epimerase/dehydratase family protein [Spelaeibacter cavernicola]KAA0021515.1 NAD-dependent epimerase/dehydratase family protein [Spelaeibacter cavernicola]